jgi:hypothetical protein
MPGEPTTPLFSITDFISGDPNQVRAFDTSATSWRITTVIRIVGAAKHSAIGDPGSRAILLVSIVACTPSVEVLDLEVDRQVFVIHRYSPL